MNLVQCEQPTLSGAQCRQTVRSAETRGKADCGRHEAVATPESFAPASLAGADLAIHPVDDSVIADAAARLVEATRKRARHVPNGRTQAEVDREFARLDDEVSAAAAALDAAVDEADNLDQARPVRGVPGQ